MAEYYDITINDFYKRVDKWRKGDGNDFFCKRAKESKKGTKELIISPIYTVLWTLLALADRTKQGEAQGAIKADLFDLVTSGCKIPTTDPSPNFHKYFLNYDSVSRFQNDMNKDYGVTGDTTIKVALEKIEEFIEKQSGEKKRDDFHTARTKMFDKVNVGDEKMNTTTYESYKLEIEEDITNGAKQIILTGAPGTGKTTMAKEIAGVGSDEKIGLGQSLPWTTDKARYELVQFHPSYDYTDFIEGLRPVETESGKVEFKKLDGIFKRFCRYVAERNEMDAKNSHTGEVDKEQYKKVCEDNKYFFLIDEINRADLSKVFGELMYCLESDKRGPKNRIQTQYQNLTQFFTEREDKGYLRMKKFEEKVISEYHKQQHEAKQHKDEKFNEQINSAHEEVSKRKDVFEDGFYIPENVIIIGTMNDIDRSVESMDYALRRRFLWKEIKVTKELLKNAFQTLWVGVDVNVAEAIADRVNKLNEKAIRKNNQFGLDRQYFISQGQFANLPENTVKKLKDVYSDEKIKDDRLKDFLEDVFEKRIEPLLREYVRGEAESEVEEFIARCRSTMGLPNGNGSNT